jgi:hypothetical protein
LKAAHITADLIDFPDDVIAHHEWRPACGSLRVEVAPDQHIRVLHARREHADPHLAYAGRWQGSVDHLQPVGPAEAPELNNSVAGLAHIKVVSRHYCVGVAYAATFLSRGLPRDRSDLRHCLC